MMENLNLGKREPSMIYFGLYMVLMAIASSIYVWSSPRTDMCEITEVTEYRDDNGVTHKRTVLYFVPQNERPITL